MSFKGLLFTKEIMSAFCRLWGEMSYLKVIENMFCNHFTNSFSKELSFLINSQGLLWNSLGREWHLVGDRRIWNSYIWVKSLRSRFITVNFFFRWRPVVWGILVPSPGFELVPPLRWKYGVLTTGPPGKSQAITLIYLIFMYLAVPALSCSMWDL